MVFSTPSSANGIFVPIFGPPIMSVASACLFGATLAKYDFLAATTWFAGGAISGVLMIMWLLGCFIRHCFCRLFSVEG